MAVDPGRELLILGVLFRSPLSAYALTQTVKMHGPLYKSLARGNIYELLENLEKRGFVVTAGERASRGPRKTKTVYSLSPSGRRRFEALLAQIVVDMQAPDATLEVAFVLLGALPRERAVNLFAERLTALVAHEKRVKRLYGDAEERSAAALLAMTHATNKIGAEIAWTRGTLRDLRNPKWKSQWVLDDDATGRGRRRA
jgi:DNA-binding PadR family transcriptional regulator